MKNVLVCGGSGYIGSHTVKELLTCGYNPMLYDRKEPEFNGLIKNVKCVVGDLSDYALLEKTIRDGKIETVIHFAGYIEVGESVAHPEKYYENNVCKTLNLLNCMVACNVKNIVFSSSAAVYGCPREIPIKEDALLNPINPYGETKYAIERMLGYFEKAYGIRYVALRYFNAAGADKSGLIGERHSPETHLIPIVLNALCKDKEIKVFGNDYNTKDGTCIRDYVHVTDLANAHILAVKHLASGGQSRAYNVGSGVGFSIKEIISIAEKVTNKKARISYEKRREGDPSVLLADITSITTELRWTPENSSIENIIQTAWDWLKTKDKV